MMFRTHVYSTIGKYLRNNLLDKKLVLGGGHKFYLNIFTFLGL
jgi:hypothetical protein